MQSFQGFDSNRRKSNPKIASSAAALLQWVAHDLSLFFSRHPKELLDQSDLSYDRHL
jgi:hypothetical protein